MTSEKRGHLSESLFNRHRRRRCHLEPICDVVMFYLYTCEALRAQLKQHLALEIELSDFKLWLFELCWVLCNHLAMIGCDILLTINIVVFFVLSWFEFCRKCVYAFSCNAIETIIIYTQAIEKGDWWSNTSHNVDRANLHWFLFPIDTNEFNGELTINADSLWLWCLLCINSTRLLHHLLGSHVLHWILPIWSWSYA